MKPCVACGELCNGGWQLDGQPESALPVCPACYAHGADDSKFAKWWNESVALIEAWPRQAVTSGNLAEDRRRVELDMKQEERIRDGVCPNGCARLERIDSHSVQCPACKFVLNSNVPINLP